MLEPSIDRLYLWVPLANMGMLIKAINIPRAETLLYIISYMWFSDRTASHMYYVVSQGTFIVITAHLYTKLYHISYIDPLMC